MDNKNPGSRVAVFIAVTLALVLIVGTVSGAFFVSRMLKDAYTDNSDDKDVLGDRTGSIPNNLEVKDCYGLPSITSFSAEPQLIDSGGSTRLSWGKIRNADFVSIDNGLGNVPIDGGSVVVSPIVTTVYTLEAKCRGVSETVQVVVNVGPSFSVNKVLLTADPPTYDGACPKTLTFQGTISANKAGSVIYKWERSDLTVSADQVVEFVGSGTKTISTTITQSESVDGWTRLKITSPTQIESDKATYVIKCKSAGNFRGYWYHNFGNIDLTQIGAEVKGTIYSAFTTGSGKLYGTVTDNLLSGTYSVGGSSGSFSIALNEGGKTFEGTFGDGKRWCGSRSDIPFVPGCSFSGDWEGKLQAFEKCKISLVRTNMNVTGTYCNGKISGIVSPGFDNEIILDGSWDSTASHGTLKLYLEGYLAKQFRGNYNNEFEWCGWRSDSSEPIPCLK